MIDKKILIPIIAIVIVIVQIVGYSNLPSKSAKCKNVQLSTPQAMIDFILLKFSVIGL